MRNFIIGGLAVAGGLYLAKSATCYVLTKYKKEIREYVVEKVVNYFFTDEDGEEIDDSELIMTAINAYLKKKGATK
jgi:predicted nucleic-acid-binding protein